MTCDTLQVKVNGADPGNGAALCIVVNEIAVTGGPGENTIDLSAVNSVDYTTLVTVTVDGAGANDVITGTAIADTIVGDDGNDILNGGDGKDYMPLCVLGNRPPPYARAFVLVG